MTQYLPLRVRVKNFLKKLLPRKLFEAIRIVWIRTFARFVQDNNILATYTKRFLAAHPLVIQAGPFKGLNYVDTAIGSSYLHKLIGSYEAILHPYIYSLEGRNFDTVIDIGSAEGIYTVGFGRMFPEARLIGFELEKQGRDLNREFYAKNNLKNELTLLEEARAENVAPFITDKTLLVCDCEGGEVDILNPEVNSAYKNIDTAIIELHDFIRPGAKEVLTERFKGTHTIKLIPFKLANPDDFPFFATVNDEHDLYELRRERGWQEQEWMVLERK